jgi:hypothetical protein
MKNLKKNLTSSFQKKNNTTSWHKNNREDLHLVRSRSQPIRRVMNILESSVSDVEFDEGYSTAPDVSIQEAIETGIRCHEMLLRILDVLKLELTHQGGGATMSPTDLLHKIIGLASEYNLPEIREKALDCQEAGQRG